MRRGGWLVAGLILLVTLGVALMQSAGRPIEPDEMYGYFTATEPSAAAIVHTQSTAPISLDPPTFQLISHWTMAVVGRTALGMRLPSILGFLLMQAGLFVFVRRLGGVWAGWFAMLFPLATYSFHYAAQGRPYGLLLGCYGVALACWQGASRREERRGWLLVGLAAALVIAVTSHFFGLLILLPLCAAEGVRTLLRRKLDGPMLTALGLGLLSVAILLPFRKAVLVYQAYYYTRMPGMRTISLAYRKLFLSYPRGWGQAAQRNALIVLTLFTLAIFYAAWRRFRARGEDEPDAEWVAVAVLAALPFFGYAVAVVVTKTMEVRYVMPALLGMTILLAQGLRPVFEGAVGRYVALAAVAILAVVSFTQAAATDREARAAMADDMSRTGTGGPLYLVDMGMFVTHWFYADPALRARMIYVYSEEREIALMEHNVNFLTAIYMTRIAPEPHVISYEDFAARSRQAEGAMVVAYPHSGWDWMPLELAARKAEVQPMGTALGGDLERVILP